MAQSGAAVSRDDRNQHEEFGAAPSQPRNAPRGALQLRPVAQTPPEGASRLLPAERTPTEGASQRRPVQRTPAGSASEVRPVERTPAGGVPGRRTVTIRGQGAERYVPRSSRSRPPERRYERSGFRPDRAAMWAVLLGMLLIAAAAASAHAATVHAAASALH
jgi:hypothetical protein